MSPGRFERMYEYARAVSDVCMSMIVRAVRTVARRWSIEYHSGRHAASSEGPSCTRLPMLIAL